MAFNSAQLFAQTAPALVSGVSKLFSGSSNSSSSLPTLSGVGVDSSGNPVFGSQSSSVASDEPSMTSTLNSATAALDAIYKLSDRNSARSEAQAAELRDWQQRQNQIAMDFNSAEAAKNRDWQQMMSSTAHQREVADLRAAGLNPVLSAMGGNGASVTSGATASGMTSSGAMGQTDMSATQALVQLLGTMWSAQTQVEMQRASAQNNLAIAERNAQASEAVAHIYGQYGLTQQEMSNENTWRVAGLSSDTSKEIARLSGEYNLRAVQLSGDTSRDIASLQAENSRAIAEISGKYGIEEAQIYAAASKTVASINAQASRTVAGINANANITASQIHADASKYASDLGLRGTQIRTVADTVTAMVTNRNTVSAYKYSADKAASSAKDVANINGLYGIGRSAISALPGLLGQGLLG